MKRVWRRRGGGKGFIDAERKGSIVWTCLDKTQKTLRLQRMAGPIVCARFFDFFARAQKSLSPSLRPTMGYKERLRTALALYPAVTSRAFGWNGHGLRRPPPWVINCITYLSAPRNEKVRTHLRIDRYPPPNQLPATLFCTPFAILLRRPQGCRFISFYQLFPLTAASKSRTNKGVAKETSPYCLRIEQPPQIIPLPLKEKRNFADWIGTSGPRQRPGYQNRSDP